MRYDICQSSLGAPGAETFNHLHTSNDITDVLKSSWLVDIRQARGQSWRARHRKPEEAFRPGALEQPPLGWISSLGRDPLLTLGTTRRFVFEEPKLSRYV